MAQGVKARAVIVVVLHVVQPGGRLVAEGHGHRAVLGLEGDAAPQLRPDRVGGQVDDVVEELVGVLGGRQDLGQQAHDRLGRGGGWSGAIRTSRRSSPSSGGNVRQCCPRCLRTNRNIDPGAAPRVKSATRVARPPCRRHGRGAVAGGRGLVVAIMGNVRSEEAVMSARKTFLSWPVVRQLTGDDPLGRGPAVTSARTRVRSRPVRRPPTGSCRASAPTARSAAASASSSRTSKVVQIEGDPDSPVSRGPAVPQGLGQRAARQPRRAGRRTMLYRRPVRHGVGAAGPRDGDRHGRRPDRRQPGAHAGRTPTRTGAASARTLGIAGLGGATLDNEENYLIKKLFTAMGAIQIENQARI